MSTLTENEKILRGACEIAKASIKDFLEKYKNDGSYHALDMAVSDMKNDALPALQGALKMTKETDE